MINLRQSSCGLAALTAMILLTACEPGSTTVFGGGTDSDSDGGVSIRGKSYTGSFGDAGQLSAQTDQSASGATALQLYGGRPAEAPGTGTMMLRHGALNVSAPEGASLPLYGTALLRVGFTDATGPNACSNAQFLTEFDIDLIAGVPSVRNEEEILKSPALVALASENVTLCTSLTSDFDGQFQLGDFELVFDGGESLPTFMLHNGDFATISLLIPGEVFTVSTEVPSGGMRLATLDEAEVTETIKVRAGDTDRGLVASADCPPVTGANYEASVEWDGQSLNCTAEQDTQADTTDAVSGETMFVPVDNANGTAVATSATIAVGGIDYAVVGVLGASSNDSLVPNSRADMAVDLAALGMTSVSKVHWGTFTVDVADVANGVEVGTLRFTFAGAASSVTVPLILGENTAEWSHDRPEHDAAGGVLHDRPDSLYTFDSQVESSSTYEGRVYTGTVTFPSPRRLEGVELTLTAPEVVRPEVASLGLVAPPFGQSVVAMTLEGRVNEDPDLTSGNDDDTTDGDADPDDPDGTDDGMDDDPPVLGSVAGTVLNAITSEPLANVRVTVGGSLGSVLTGADGTYEINDIEVGTYAIDMTLVGFVSESDSVVVQEDDTATFDLELFPAGIVEGEVVNAQTGQALSGVTVRIEGTNALATTNSAGQFSINNAPQGERTLSAERAGFVTATTPVTVDPAEPTEVSVGLLAVGAGGDGVAITLAWGLSPRDLDIHVSGPDDQGGRFHIAFYSLQPVAFASLDLDDTTSYGPETVTVSPKEAEVYVPGTYSVWVHNFSDEAEFDVSGGIITIFAAGAQVAQHRVGDATGSPIDDIWRVVEFTVEEDGTISNVTEIQAFEAGTSSSEF